MSFLLAFFVWVMVSLVSWLITLLFEDLPNSWGITISLILGFLVSFFGLLNVRAKEIELEYWKPEQQVKIVRILEKTDCGCRTQKYTFQTSTGVIKVKLSESEKDIAETAPGHTFSLVQKIEVLRDGSERKGGKLCFNPNVPCFKVIE